MADPLPALESQAMRLPERPLPVLEAELRQALDEIAISAGCLDSATSREACELSRDIETARARAISLLREAAAGPRQREAAEALESLVWACGTYSERHAKADLPAGWVALLDVVDRGDGSFQGVIRIAYDTYKASVFRGQPIADSEAVKADLLRRLALLRRALGAKDE